MSPVLLYKSKIAHHTIKVYQWNIPAHVYGRDDDYTGFSYEITGGGWNVGTLHTDNTTPADCKRKAIARVREDHPRAYELTLFDDLIAYYMRHGG